MRIEMQHYSVLIITSGSFEDHLYIMGMFSFDCSCCGSHEQFDWATDCLIVVRRIGSLPDVLVKGYYDGYGRVEVATTGDSSVEFYDIQFKEYFEAWGSEHVNYVSYGIYCNGEGPGQDNWRSLLSRVISQAASRGTCVLGSRYCAPASQRIVNVIDLTELHPDCIHTILPDCNRTPSKKRKAVDQDDGEGVSSQKKKTKTKKTKKKKKKVKDMNISDLLGFGEVTLNDYGDIVEP